MTGRGGGGRGGGGGGGGRHDKGCGNNTLSPKHCQLQRQRRRRDGNNHRIGFCLMRIVFSAALIAPRFNVDITSCGHNAFASVAVFVSAFQPIRTRTTTFSPAANANSSANFIYVHAKDGRSWRRFIPKDRGNLFPDDADVAPQRRTGEMNFFATSYQCRSSSYHCLSPTSLFLASTARTRKRAATATVTARKQESKFAWPGRRAAMKYTVLLHAKTEEGDGHEDDEDNNATTHKRTDSASTRDGDVGAISRPMGDSNGDGESDGATPPTEKGGGRSGDVVVIAVVNNNNDDDNDNDQNGANKIKEIIRLKHENDMLKKLVAELEEENRYLESRPPQRIVIESFEGGGRPMKDSQGEMVHFWFEDGKEYFGAGTVSMPDEGELMEKKGIEGGNGNDNDNGGVAKIGGKKPVPSVDTAGCDDDDDDTCPVEPDVSFNDALRERAYWLVGLLAMQSLSGFILARNEELLQSHPVIVYFLTMLVGAGGNAGNQASVRVIRGLALGTLNEQTQRRFLSREFKMAISLSTVLSLAGFARAAIFRTPVAETIAVTASLCIIVFCSICLGAILPLLLKRLGVDPAHSSTTIQVVMDILGVFMTVIVSTVLLDSPVGQALIAKLSFGI